MTQTDQHAISSLRLVWPTEGYLPGYIAALERGWSPDNVRGVEATREILEKISRDRQRYLQSLVDREAKGDPVVLPDGSKVPRLPDYNR